MYRRRTKGVKDARHNYDPDNTRLLRLEVIEDVQLGWMSLNSRTRRSTESIKDQNGTNAHGKLVRETTNR